MSNRIWIAAALLAAGDMAHADVTVTTTTAGNASIIDVGGTGTSMIKGNRMRSDAVVGSRLSSLVIDTDGKRFIDIDDRKKSAVIIPLESIAEQLNKVGVGAMDATLKKTGETKKIAGFSCTVHDISITVPFSMTGKPGDGMDMNLIASGTVCLSTDAPGLKDYQQFYRAAADSGFIFGDPRTAKSPTGAAQAKAYAQLTRKMAAAGMALESHITMTATGDGPMAGMMAKLAHTDITATVTKIETGDLPAEKFDVPAGYKVKTK